MAGVEEREYVDPREEEGCPFDSRCVWSAEDTSDLDDLEDSEREEAAPARRSVAARRRLARDDPAGVVREGPLPGVVTTDADRSS